GLLFNIQSNPGMPIRAIQTAMSDAPAELVVVRPGKDRGSARVRSAAAVPEKGAQRIQAQTLLQLLQSERIDRPDAIKIDVDGCEDRILVPFFRSTRRDAWSMDLFSFLVTTGYTIAARSKQNVMLHLESAHP
ncbi:MAG: FkbM family methyltransferase, partial [Pseudolabrys sp.]